MNHWINSSTYEIVYLPHPLYPPLHNRNISSYHEGRIVFIKKGFASRYSGVIIGEFKRGISPS